MDTQVGIWVPLASDFKETRERETFCDRRKASNTDQDKARASSLSLFPLKKEEEKKKRHRGYVTVNPSLTKSTPRRV